MNYELCKASLELDRSDPESEREFLQMFTENLRGMFETLTAKDPLALKGDVETRINRLIIDISSL